MTAATRVGVVTLNWNGLADTRACLASLAGTEGVRAYVVDNASAGDEAAVLAAEFPAAVVLPQPANLGFTGGCNVGMERALADGCTHVLLLNNDCTVTPGFLPPLLAVLDRPGVGAAASLQLYADRDEVWCAGARTSVLDGFTHLLGKGRPAAEYAGREPYPVEFAAAAGLLVSAETVRRVGGLDDAYFAYYEDADWCARIAAAGLATWLVPASVMRHRKSASTGAAGTTALSPTAAYYQARNAFRFGRTHLRGGRRAVFLLAQLLVRAPANLLLRSQPRSRSSYLAGVRDGIAGRGGPR